MFRDGMARLLVFQLGAERFAVALDSVDEVIDVPIVQPLPDALPNVRGITTVHGALVTVYDPRPLLNVVDGFDGAALVFVRDSRRVALAVDDVFDAITVRESELRSAPGAGGADGILIGVIRVGNDLFAVIDATALLNAAMVVSEGERM